MSRSFFEFDLPDYNIEVPNYIMFSKTDSMVALKGLNNINQCISSNAKKFRYCPDDIGWIPSNSCREIFVQTNELEAKNFEDIISEVFQATTIHHKEPLDMPCLNALWTMDSIVGTELFPEELCEKHLIKHVYPVYPKEYSYLDKFSLLDRLKLYF